jgi:hypothetical protein
MQLIHLNDVFAAVLGGDGLLSCSGIECFSTLIYSPFEFQHDESSMRSGTMKISS